MILNVIVKIIYFSFNKNAHFIPCFHVKKKHFLSFTNLVAVFAQVEFHCITYLRNIRLVFEVCFAYLIFKSTFNGY